MERALFEKYLRLLDIAAKPPSREALGELVAAHMTRVPFENISKLYYRKRFGLTSLPSLEQYLGGMEQYHFGGTCFSNNSFFNQLLTHLGYDAMLCGADMGNPDGHLVNMVSVEGRDFLIDAGYAAPFLEPLPRDLDRDVEVILGRDRYVLHPQDDRGCSRLDLYRDGELFHGYTAKPIPRTIEYFARRIEGSFGPTATFMSSLLVVRLFPNRSTVVYNTTMIQSEGDQFEKTSLGDRSELPGIIERHMQIPREIVAEALTGLGDLKNPWN